MRFTRHLAFATLVAALVVGLGCRPDARTAAPATPTPQATATLTVFAGAASKPALEELARDYQMQRHVKVDVTFGGSGAVLTQFSQEHYGDVYVPGSDDFMDRAEKKDTVQASTRKALVYLVPTLCVAKGNPKQIKGLADLARKDVRTVLGDPKSVCLGAIAKSTLEAEGTWTEVSSHLASYATSCENVLQALLLGEADAVVGWDVFARQHPDKVESLALPDKYRKARNIPAAVIKWSSQTAAAQAFIDYLAAPEAAQVWEQHGYTIQAPGQKAGPAG
jgi:molybdate transport system substrate-binding protein